MRPCSDLCTFVFLSEQTKQIIIPLSLLRSIFNTGATFVNRRCGLLLAYAFVKRLVASFCLAVIFTRVLESTKRLENC